MIDNQHPANSPFAIKDCALIAIATGQRARNLREMVGYLQTISVDSIYYHFWGTLLRPRFDDPEYHNDFAIWAAHQIHDRILAERLAVIYPVEYNNLEDLRQELIEVIEERLDEIDFPVWAHRDRQFEFIRSQIVVFDTHRKAHYAQEFVEIIPQMSVGSIFFHLIDARRRHPESIDDFQNWLLEFGDEYAELRQKIGEIDPYYSSLSQLRNELSQMFKNYFLQR